LFVWLERILSGAMRDSGTHFGISVTRSTGTQSSESCWTTALNTLCARSDGDLQPTPVGASLAFLTSVVSFVRNNTYLASAFNSCEVDWAPRYTRTTPEGQVVERVSCWEDLDEIERRRAAPDTSYASERNRWRGVYGAPGFWAFAESRYALGTTGRMRDLRPWEDVAP
jgi:hypothetical protein